MFDREAHGLTPVGKVFVFGKFGTELLVEDLVRAIGKVTNVIEKSKDSDRTLAFNQLTHNDIVKEFDGRPVDAFFDVFLLLFFQRQLNENLLKLFVDKINLHGENGALEKT